MSGTNGNGNGEEEKDDLADFLREMADVEPLKNKTAEPWKKRLRPEPLPKAADEDGDDFADRNIDTPTATAR